MSHYFNKVKKFRGGLVAFLAVVAFFSVFLPIQNCYAQEILPLTVSPARQSVNVDPGSTEGVNISFLNQAEVPIAGNIKVVDFIVNDDQGSPLLLENTEAMSSRYSAAAWVKLHTEKAVIAPNDLFKIPVRIVVPPDAAPGGRYVAVYFEPTGTYPSVNSLETQKEGVQTTTPRVVGLLYIRVNGPITEAAVVKKLKVPRFVEFGPVDVALEILNKGDYHITPIGNLTLTNWSGKNVDEYALEKKNIFPEKSRSYETNLGKRLMFGRYSVSALALYGDSGKVVEATEVFWAFPIRLVLIIILTITAIILALIYLSRKIKKTQHKLEEKLEAEISEIEALKQKYQDKITNLPGANSKK